MKPRHAYRLRDKQQANAARCGVALTEWLALPRARRKELLRHAKGADRG